MDAVVIHQYMGRGWGWVKAPVLKLCVDVDML